MLRNVIDLPSLPIQNPVAATYRIPCSSPYLPSRSLEVTLSGKKVSKLKTCHPTYATIIYKSGEWITNSTAVSMCITKDALPMSYAGKNLPPVMFFMPNLRMLIAPTKLFITVDLDFPNPDSAFGTNDFVILAKLQADNNEMQREYQSLTNIPVRAGNFALFKEEKRPSAEVLFELFKSFVLFNPKEKLANQYEKTAGACHLRSHFVSLMLAAYGIQSYTIAQYWQEGDWKPLENTKQIHYAFHAAVTVIDNQNNKWVWDPWETSSEKLVSVNEWLHNVNFPTPREARILNRMVCNKIPISLQDGMVMADGVGVNFESSFDVEPDIKLLRFLFSNAMPNPPERPLSLRGRELLSEVVLPKEAVPSKPDVMKPVKTSLAKMSLFVNKHIVPVVLSQALETTDFLKNVFK